MDSTAGKKRKRTDKPTTKRSQITKAEPSDEASIEDEVLELEAQILESRKHYNNIPRLISLAKEGRTITSATTLPAVALCRIYCRLFANGSLSKSKTESESEAVIAKWLRARLDEYFQLLGDSIQEGDEGVQVTALTLAMRLVKEDVNQDGQSQWQRGIFPGIVSAVLRAGEAAQEDFSERYFSQFDDVRVYALHQIIDVLKQDPSPAVVDASLDMMAELEQPSEKDESQPTLFVTSTSKDAQRQVSGKKQRKAVQNAWLAILKCPLSKQQNKLILTNLVDRILPYFTKAELLMDYLTDSFSLGGSTALLALSGLFHLMQSRNLDYPSFYMKLYSLLDDDLLHSRHRSRFFRHLAVFTSSTHLPAALVASFIKRLCRLALHAPPAGIVVVVPWVYNMFKTHPQCTFMIHRKLPPTSRSEDSGAGFLDPFDPDEPDPTETGALGSSIWEIHTLQAHWHPNVATLARIVGEPFTKDSYNLEDFLDHSYASLIEAEVGGGDGRKEMKRPPVVEWEIPKHVFLSDGDKEGEGGMNEFGRLMGRVLESRA